MIFKDNKVNLFVSSLLFVFWYHSPNFLDTKRTKLYVYSRGQAVAQFCKGPWKIVRLPTSIFPHSVAPRSINPLTDMTTKELPEG
jgi:hypothetical protein